MHMLNATLCATGRAICCLLENYQTTEGVRIPEVLVPFMGGLTFLPFVRDSKLPLPAAVSTTTTTTTSNTTSATTAVVKEVQKEEVSAAVVAPVVAESEAVVPPPAPVEKKEKAAKKKEKEGKKKEKEPEIVYVTTPEVVKPAPAYISPAPEVSSQDYAAAASASADSTEEVIPTAEEVVGKGGAGEEVLAVAEARLFYYSFIGGDRPTAADVTVFEVVKEAEVAAYPNVARWLRYVNATAPAIRATW